MYVIQSIIQALGLFMFFSQTPVNVRVVSLYIMVLTGQSVKPVVVIQTECPIVTSFVRSPTEIVRVNQKS